MSSQSTRERERLPRQLEKGSQAEQQRHSPKRMTLRQSMRKLVALEAEACSIRRSLADLPAIQIAERRGRMVDSLRVQEVFID